MRNLLFALCCLLLAGAAPAVAQDGRWVRVESEGFIVYGAASEQSLANVARELEVFDGLLRRMTGASTERSPTKLEVYLLDSDRFGDVFPDMRSSIAGVYTARVDQIAAFAIFTDRGGLDGREILFHEYAHHFMYQYFANAYPAWYIEGFAEFVSTAVLGSERIVLGRSSEGRFYSLRNDTWLPMERLLTATPHELSSADAATFYAQSWLFTHYLVLTPGKMAQFEAYVSALRQGQEPAAALQAGFGMTPEQMQGELRRYYRGSPNALALTRPAGVERSPMQVTRMPPSANALLPLMARLRRGAVSEDEAPAFLARIRQAAGSAQADRYALVSLAHAEAELGDRTAARALLEPHLAASPDDAEALYVMGLTYLRDAGDASGEERLTLLSRARRHFARAYRIDQNYVPAVYRYAESYDGVRMDQATFENYLNVLLLARQLAPQVDEITISAAYALIGAERHAEAIPLLRALAYDPHGGASAELARRLLSEAEAEAAAAR